MTIPIYPEAKVALKGKKGLIVGIANDQSIAWGCAKAFRALGADLAVTYLNDRARKHVEALAKALEAPIFMPLDVNTEGQLEQVFEKIQKEWGQLDFLLHSIAFSPKDALTDALSMSIATASRKPWMSPAGHSSGWRIWPSP